MPEIERCPICHSEISPEPKWTNDPILTIRGLAGDEYKGIIHPNVKHITELQDERKQQEIDMSLEEKPEEPVWGEIYKTEFTEIVPLTLKINKKHINALRKSTEKLLDLKGLELIDYFNNDEYGDYIGTYKYGQKISNKEEWTDVNRDYDMSGVRTSYSILSSSQEILFRNDFDVYASQWGVNPDPDAEEHYYDYRGLWKDKGGIFPDEEGHLSSAYKLIDHPNLIINGINTVTGEGKVPLLPFHPVKVKAIHIEDLRHPVPELYYGFGILSSEWYVETQILRDKLFTYKSNNKETDEEYGDLTQSLKYTGWLGFSSEYRCGDNSYFWSEHNAFLGFGIPDIYRISGRGWRESGRITWEKTNIAFGKKYYLVPRFVASDNKYLWVIGYLMGVGLYLYKINIKDLTDQMVYEVDWGFQYDENINGFIRRTSSLRLKAMDLKYFYGEKDITIYTSDYSSTEDRFLRLCKYNKSDFSIEMTVDINRNLWSEGTYFSGFLEQLPPGSTQYYKRGEDYYYYMGNDEEYLYYRMSSQETRYELIHKLIQFEGLPPRWYWYYEEYYFQNDISLVKFDKEFFTKTTVMELASRGHSDEFPRQIWSIAIGKNLIYILSQEVDSSWQYTGKVSIYKKEDMSLINEYINQVGDFEFNRYSYQNTWIGTSDEAYIASKLPKYLQEE